MGTYKYDFSVVMAGYNVEAFLKEAVDSIIHQSIGFSRIQVILVDDGSSDASGKICDEYAVRYPENVLVIHKVNGRQASARNAGLKYIEGKYINFMDSDDTMDPDAFEKVWTFMEAHKEEVDICSIPIYFWGSRTGSHPLNNKFADGTRVINLLEKENTKFFQLSAAAAFYRASIARQMNFDTELYQGEDAKENLKLLLERPVLGVVAGTKYNYRKHGSSIMDQGMENPCSYITHLQRFSTWMLDLSKNKYGRIVEFIQYALMYDLQWRLNMKSIPQGVLSYEEELTYKDLLFKLIAQIDDEVIMQQQYISFDKKLYVLSKKYGRNFDAVPGKKEKIFKSGIKGFDSIVSGDVKYQYGNSDAADLSETETCFEFLRNDSAEGKLIIEGCHKVYGIDSHDYKPCLLVNGKVIECELVKRERYDVYVLGERIAYTIGFRAEIPADGRNLRVTAGLLLNDVVIQRNKIKFGKYFPLTDRYDNAYAEVGDYFVRYRKGQLFISARPGWIARTRAEYRFLREIWNKNLLGGRKAVLSRILYHAMKLLKREQIWIVSDRVMKVGDNGEALYRYLLKNKPRKTKVFFAISKSSEDYERMKKLGNCVNFLSHTHKLLYLLCDVNISSQASVSINNLYLNDQDALRDLLQHQAFVFLQHGIIKDDMSGWLNRYNMNIEGFVTSTNAECKSIVFGNYNYTEKQVWLTGLPRYDYLYRNEKNIVTIMPTWRRNLMKDFDPIREIWQLGDDFEEQEFYQFYNQLLNSEKLLNGLEQYRYKLQFLPHLNL